MSPCKEEAGPWERAAGRMLATPERALCSLPVSLGQECCLLEPWVPVPLEKATSLTCFENEGSLPTPSPPQRGLKCSSWCPWEPRMKAKSYHSLLVHLSPPLLYLPLHPPAILPTSHPLSCFLETKRKHPAFPVMTVDILHRKGI